MVEVFKTNVRYEMIAREIKEELQIRILDAAVSFDLEDCDKILRIDTEVLDADMVINILKKKGFICEVLE